MVEEKPKFKYKDPAVLGKAKRTALGRSVLPIVGRAAGHLMFPGQPCCQTLHCHHGAYLSWHTHTKLLRISLKQPQTYRKVETMV